MSAVGVLDVLGLSAARDGDVKRCRAAVKRLDAAVARAMRRQPDWRRQWVQIGGEYALAHGFCGNAARVREFGGKVGQALHPAAAIPLFEDDVAPFDVPEFAHSLAQCIEEGRNRFACCTQEKPHAIDP